MLRLVQKHVPCLVLVQMLVQYPGLVQALVRVQEPRDVEGQGCTAGHWDELGALGVHWVINSRRVQIVRGDPWVWAACEVDPGTLGDIGGHPGHPLSPPPRGVPAHWRILGDIEGGHVETGGHSGTLWEPPDHPLCPHRRVPGHWGEHMGTLGDPRDMEGLPQANPCPHRGVPGHLGTLEDTGGHTWGHWGMLTDTLGIPRPLFVSP